MTRVVHLTTVHPSDDSRIFHKECRSLAATGYEVILVAPEKEGPRGLGVDFRVLPPVHGRGARVIISSLRALRTAIALKADIYHFHDPELLPVGIVLRALGQRVIYDAHEDLPQQILAKPWIARPLRRPLAWTAAVLQWLISRTLSGIVAATPKIADRFPKSRTVCVQNFPIVEEFATPQPVPYEERPLDIVYVGRVDRVRGAREMVLAMEHLGAHSSARLRIGGKVFEPTLQRELDALPSRNRVDFLGWLDRFGVASLLSQVRVGLVVLHPTPAYLDSYPIKLFEYMAAGIPVVASDFPLWRSIVEDADCGLLVDPLEPAAIATAVQRLLDHPSEARAMGERGRRAIFAQYSWRPQAERLIGLYSRLCGDIPITAAPARRAAFTAMPSIKP